MKDLKASTNKNERQVFYFPCPSRKLWQRETYCLSKTTKNTVHHMEALENDNIKQNDSSETHVISYDNKGN
jgi:hypothetical protein